MRKVLLFTWSICFFLGTVAVGSNLEINIFNVGWGNFVLLKRDNNVLVIDCGKAGAFQASEAKERLRNILRGSNNCRVIITHDHKDHYSAARVLWDCFHKVSKRNAEFFYGWVSSDGAPLTRETRKNAVKYYPLSSNPNVLDRCLGGGILIRCIIPVRENEDCHVNNLVVGIKYGNISFVFPGDANQDWFSENCERLKAFLEELGWVNFLLIPHHGSMSDTGFFMKDAIENFTKGTLAPNEGRRLMYVISSDPQKGKYYMPRQGVQYLFSHWCCISKVKPHRLSVAKVDLVSKELKEVVAIGGLASPVFSTADSVFGYKIVCDGLSFWMYEELGIPRPRESIADLKVFDYYGLARQR
ncbi:MAG: MBL fold metallo-hydrolase [Puniceicoccales bacterium]|jgi:beta-lactamase superfamily II metal-dependent hydrolase|nr:MBL fold metallo-hydrolase [Puniceicoccales bacterium]